MENLNKSMIMQEMSLQEMENLNGGIAPLLIALAWGFGLGFTSGVAIGIAKNV